MEKEFIPYELAVKLKALGFDEKVLSYFEKGAVKIYTKSIYGWDCNAPFVTRVSRPTFSQAFRWFREKYGLYSWVKLHNGYVNDSFYEKLPITWTVMEHESGKQHYEKDTDNYLYHTHEEAELACLTKLIEIVESKSE